MPYEKPNRYSGGGCVHNPKFSTERGKRRHIARTPDEKQRVEKLWAGEVPKPK